MTQEGVEISSLDQFLSLIKCLNGGNPEEIFHANALLMDFIENDISWVWSLDLLKCDDEFARFFSANFLLTKVKRHWLSLNKDQRIDIFDFLLNTIQGFGLMITDPNSQFESQTVQSFLLFITRLGMVFAIVCCQSENPRKAISLYADLAVAIMLGDEEELDTANSSVGVIVGCELLALLPGEVEKLDISRPHRVEMSESLSTTLTIMLKKFDAVVAKRAPISSEECCVIIKCLRQWKLEGISLSKMSSPDTANLTAMIMNCTTSPSVQAMCRAIAFLADVVHIGEYPRPQTRNDIISELLRTVTGSDGDNSTLVNLISNPESDLDALNTICCSLSSIGAKEVSYIISEVGYDHRFIDLMLQLTRVRPCRIAIHTYDFWCALEDVSSTVRDAVLGQDVMVSLVQAICQQMSYWHRGETLTYDGDDDDEEEETNIMEFVSCQGTQDTLKLCLQGLGPEYFFGLLRSNISVLDGGYAQIAEPIACIALEASVSVLIVVMEVIKTSWQVLITSSTSSMSMAGCSPAALPPIALVLELLDYLLSHPFKAEFPSFMLNTCCRLVGAATFMLSTEQDCTRHLYAGRNAVDIGSDMYELALAFLFDSFGAATCNATVSITASNSLLRLCTHGVKRLTKCSEGESNSVMSNIASRTAAIIASPREEGAPSSHVLVLIQATCQVISDIQFPQHAKTLLSVIGEPIRNQLAEEVASRQWTAYRMVDVLGLVAQVLRYSRPVTAPGPSTGALEDFLSSIWGHLGTVGEICLRVSTHVSVACDVLNALYVVYENAVSALPDICLKEGVLMDITELCVDGFARRRVASAMKCAAALVNAICFQADQATVSPVDSESILSSLLLRVMSLMNDSVVSTGVYETGVVREGSWVWAEEPESIEQLYIFLHLYFTMCPHVMVHICQTPIVAGNDTGRTLAHMLNELSLICLGQAKERVVVRRILHVLQAMWCPLVGGDLVQFDLTSYTQALTLPSVGYAESVLAYVARGLDGALQRDLWPNITETLYTVMTSSCDNGAEIQLTQWMYHVFVDDSNVLQNIGEDEKRLAVRALLQFAQDKKVRRFRLLVADIGKICSNELESAVLHDYVF